MVILTKNQKFSLSKVDGLKKLPTRACMFYDLMHFKGCPCINHKISCDLSCKLTIFLAFHFFTDHSVFFLFCFLTPFTTILHTVISQLSASQNAKSNPFFYLPVIYLVSIMIDCWHRYDVMFDHMCLIGCPNRYELQRSWEFTPLKVFTHTETK